MPPRTAAAVASSIFNLTSLLQSLPAASRATVLTKCTACLFSTTSPQQSIKKLRQAKKRVDPYRLAQARQRKAANLLRKEVLQNERQAALGDPVRSRSTPFVDTLRPSAPVEVLKESYLNYFVKPEELQKSLEHSKWLTEPLEKEGRHTDPMQEEAERQSYEAAHENAATAMAAIAALENGNSRDRTRVNFSRCIEEFGRHNTDRYLRPKPASKQLASHIVTEDGQALATRDNTASEIDIPKRAGTDTGSSEVQIAILTAKINVLADNLHNKDKHNKKNLRQLVHRRQKLLSYLRRKERGGPRWQNLVEKLGISDAMWRGEINL